MRPGIEMQDEILSYIKTEILRQGYPPSVREIAKGVGLHSTSTVHVHLRHLEDRGLIRRDPAKPRALEITDGTMPTSRPVPLVGRVPAGQPLFAEDNIEEYITTPHAGSWSDTLFALRVEGESMIEAGILNHDIIIVNKTDHADNGDIVVALLESDATVKRIFFEDERVRLQPENRFMEPIYAPSVQVVGKVVGLYRMY